MGSVHAQQIVIQTEEVAYYWDASHRNQITRIAALPESAWAPAPANLAWGMRQETLWLRIAARSDLPLHPVLWLQRANLDKVCLYQRELQRWDKQCRGTLDPEAQVQPEHEILNSIDSVFSLSPSVKQSQKYWYLKVRSHNWLTLPLEVLGASEYRAQRRFQILSDYAAMGAFFAVIVYNLVLLFMLKESAHLWHALVMGGWAVYWFGFILGYERMFPLSMQYFLHDAMFVLTLGVGLVWFQAFLRFTEAEMSPGLFRLVRGMQIFVLTGLPLLFWPNHSLSIYHGHVLTLILPLFMLGGLVWSFRNQKATTGFYFSSWIFFFFSLLSFSLMVSGKQPFYAGYFHGLSWLQLLSMFSIALIFALKIKGLVRAREALLLSNLQLAQSHERHLVEQVQLRTQELELTLEELKQSNQTKDQLFAVLAHDLRAPFSNLWMLMGLLEQQTFEPEELLTEVLPGLKERIKRISNSLDDMLLWAQEEIQGYSAKAQWLKPAEMVKEVCGLYSVAAEQKKLRLHFQVDPDAEIKMDPNHLRLILRNLLQNAIKFTPEGGSISFASRLAENGDFILSIEDTGVGMEPEQVAKMLAGQRQASRVGTAGETGMGIGMLLCKAYLRANQAQMCIHSQPEQGTCIQLTFKRPATGPLKNPGTGPLALAITGPLPTLPTSLTQELSR